MKSRRPKMLESIWDSDAIVVESPGCEAALGPQNEMCQKQRSYWMSRVSHLYYHATGRRLVLGLSHVLGPTGCRSHYCIECAMRYATDLYVQCSREEKEVLTRHGRRSGSGRDFGRLITNVKILYSFVRVSQQNNLRHIEIDKMNEQNQKLNSFIRLFRILRVLKLPYNQDESPP